MRDENIEQALMHFRQARELRGNIREGLHRIEDLAIRGASMQDAAAAKVFKEIAATVANAIESDIDIDSELSTARNAITRAKEQGRIAA